MKEQHLHFGVFSANSLIFRIKSSHVVSALFTWPFLSIGVSGTINDFELVFGVVLANWSAIQNQNSIN